MFQQQLYIYLVNFTDKSALIAINAATAKGVIEAYRRIADAGRSRRPEHLIKLNTEVLQPGAARSLAELETHIVTWESNLDYFHRVCEAGSQISTSQQRLILINMATKELSEFLTKESKRFPSYHDVRTEISDWIHRATSPKTMSGALHVHQVEEIVDGEALLDLDYPEDSSAQVDLNVVATGEGRMVEVQGTAEGDPFTRAELDDLMDLALDGIRRLVSAQERALG